MTDDTTVRLAEKSAEWQAVAGEVAREKLALEDQVRTLTSENEELRAGPLDAAQYLTRSAWRELEAERDRLAETVQRAGRELQGLVSAYTRAPGENGDRVADLLSADAYRIGSDLLAALADPTPGPDGGGERG